MSKSEHVYKEIESAFDSVTLDGGVSLEQTKIIDNFFEGIGESEFNNIPKTEIIGNWKNIPKVLLDEAECIAHLDSKGFKYYIPALMLRLIENYNPGSMMSIGTLGSLYPKKDHFQHHMRLYSMLNDKQSKAIALFLKFLPDLVELYSEDKKVVERAFNNYWSKCLADE